MRRLPLIALSTAAVATALVGGIAGSANAAKPPSFTVKETVVSLNETLDRCVITLNWAVSDPSRVESYLVQANNAPLRGKNTVQGNVITETTSTWEIDDDTPFYMKVTIYQVGGKKSKSWSVGSDSWSCLD